MKSTITGLTIVQKEGEEVPQSVLATVIVNISKAFSELLLTGLNKRAIVVLIQDRTALPKSDIIKVLDGLVQLRTDFCS